MVRRFYLTPADIQENQAILRGREAHHATRVMRLKVGQPLTLFDGKGQVYQGVIREISKGEVFVSLMECIAEDRKETRITVACGIPKQLRMERIVEKLTEVGVEAIFPIATERTVPRMKGKEEAKLKRWKRIATEAAKQCGASRLPDIPQVFCFSELLRLAPAYNLALFLDPAGRPLKDCLKEKKGERIIVAVGPEGGWSGKELEEAKSAGWATVSLGGHILKTDTASLAIVFILHYALDPLEKS